MIGSAAMTNRLDNLLRRRLVERPNPRDRRSVLVRLTSDGATRVDDAMRRLKQREAEEEQGTISRSLCRLVDGPSSGAVNSVRRLGGPRRRCVRQSSA